jgi:predicted RNA-binding protein (virulence factor B family)
MYFKNDFIDIERGQEVDLIVADKIDIGRRVIINGKFLGVIFTQEMLRTLREGDKIKGYVRKIEGRDIQVSMSKEGEELIIDAKNRLMEFLENNNGYIRLNDDSDPEEIKLRLRMSKKTFKKAVGVLYKEEKVIITKFGVKLNKGDK